jgi:hypothetical protein
MISFSLPSEKVGSKLGSKPDGPLDHIVGTRLADGPSVGSSTGLSTPSDGPEIDKEGENVGGSLIPTSTRTSVGPEDGKSLG